MAESRTDSRMGDGELPNSKPSSEIECECILNHTISKRRRERRRREGGERDNCLVSTGGLSTYPLSSNKSWKDVESVDVVESRRA